MRTKKADSGGGSKEDFFKSLWIPISLRLPKDEDCRVLYLTEKGYCGMTTGMIMNAQHRQLEDGLVRQEKCPPGSGYFAVKWMYIYG